MAPHLEGAGAALWETAILISIRFCRRSPSTHKSLLQSEINSYWSALISTVRHEGGAVTGTSHLSQCENIILFVKYQHYTPRSPSPFCSADADSQKWWRGRQEVSTEHRRAHVTFTSLHRGDYCWGHDKDITKGNYVWWSRLSCNYNSTYCSKYNNNNYKQFWSLFNQLNHFQAILTNISKYGCSDCNITRQLLNLWAERVGRHGWRRIPHVTHALFRLVQ